MPYAFPLLTVVAATFYYFVDPVLSHLSLPCPWKLLTSTQCPACGFQRALHALLHGEIIKALQYNYFFIVSIPYALLAVLASWYNFGHVFDKLHRFVYHRYILNIYVILFCTWWIVRNVYEI